MSRRIAALSFAAVCVLVSARAWAEPGPPEIRVFSSVPMLHVYALESVLRVPARSPAIRELLCGQHPQAGRRCVAAVNLGRKALERLRLLPPSDDTALRPRPQSPEETLEVLAARADSLEHLRLILEDALPPDVERPLRGALGAIGPLVEEYLVPTITPTQERAPRVLLKLLRIRNALRYLRRVGRVVGAVWEPTQPMVVVTVPVPVSRGTGVVTYAHQAGPIIVAEVLRDDEASHRIGVLVHEMIHALWHARPDARVRALEQAFEDEPLPTAPFAASLINEAIATALGNGLFGASDDGLLPPGEWYADPVIDLFARTLLPVLSAAMREGREIDLSFATQCSLLLGALFPGAASDPSFVFRRSLVLYEGVELDRSAVARGLRHRLRAARVHVRRLSAKNGAGRGVGRRDTALLVVPPDRIDLLEPFLDPGTLRTLVADHDAALGPPVITCRHGSGRWYAVALLDDPNLLDQALARLASARPLPECGRL